MKGHVKVAEYLVMKCGIPVDSTGQVMMHTCSEDMLPEVALEKITILAENFAKESFHECTRLR